MRKKGGSNEISFTKVKSVFLSLHIHTRHLKGSSVSFILCNRIRRARTWQNLNHKSEALVNGKTIESVKLIPWCPGTYLQTPNSQILKTRKKKKNLHFIGHTVTKSIEKVNNLQLLLRYEKETISTTETHVKITEMKQQEHVDIVNNSRTINSPSVHPICLHMS